MQLRPPEQTFQDMRRSFNMPLQTVDRAVQETAISALKAAHQKEIQALSAQLSESTELQGYYQKMAEDYRSKYLALEREFNYLKHQHGLDLESYKHEFARKEA